MANEYTSILTGGLSDNTVKTMYDFMFEGAPPGAHVSGVGGQGA